MNWKLINETAKKVIDSSKPPYAHLLYASPAVEGVIKQVYWASGAKLNRFECNEAAHIVMRKWAAYGVRFYANIVKLYNPYSRTFMQDFPPKPRKIISLAPLLN